MNTANIKKYAPKARNNFIDAVTKQAARYGITAKGTEPMEQRGDIALIGEKAFPKAIAPARKALERMVEQMGFTQAMEQAAYSWFNRLCAIRYMEIHDFLDHGRRVLSAANGEAGTPQILDDCLDISLPGLDPQQVAELKLDGNKDEELYRELLLAQCHALHEAMPFLFEAVDDATELLLPDNLTKTDSLIRELVSAIPEDDWQDVEIIGWLYQFYISEKKDQVIGKVVKSEDIPAATQLFTPNWIVQYLVQNSVGRQWLQTYPDSPLRDQMPYFIEPGEQPPEVQAQLDEAVPDAIDPESIKVLDPACGSGHILVEAYKILKAIYEERGYRSRDIPQQILKHNLFGLDIDDRAGQLAGFALMMLARQDDRRLFSRVAEGEVTLNVLSLKQTGHLNLPQVWQDLNLSGDWHQGSSQSLFENEQTDLSSASADDRYQLLQRTLERFGEAKTFGSLIEVPEEDEAPLKALVEELEHLARTGDSMQKPVAEMLLPYVRQAWVLAQRYDAVIANPPYMGSKGMNKQLKSFGGKNYPGSKHDLFSIFMERAFGLLSPSGDNAQVNMQAWMFLLSYEKLRSLIINNKRIVSLAHFGSRAFGQISGEVVQTCAWIISNYSSPHYKPTFFRLVEGDEERKRINLKARKCCYESVSQIEFKKIPCSPIAYWSSDNFRACFEKYRPVSDFAVPKQGISTCNNERFLRYWYEVDFNKIGFGFESNEDAESSGKKWFPYNKGGSYRKWYGNNEYVLNWQNGGEEVHSYNRVPKSYKGAPMRGKDWFFREGMTWSSLSSGSLGARFSAGGFAFADKGPMLFSQSSASIEFLTAVFNSKPASHFLEVLSPTLDFAQGPIGRVPFPELVDQIEIKSEAERAISESRLDWDDNETSWDFKVPPLVDMATYQGTILESWEAWKRESNRRINSILRSETRINELLIKAYGLGGEISPDVDVQDLTLASADRCREVVNIISYALGVIMGRYDYERGGLLLARNIDIKNFDLQKRAGSNEILIDKDGIIPVTDQEWFSDDATYGILGFIKSVWGENYLEDNLGFLADSLCLGAIKPKRGESALDTIRRYLSTQFYKDHLRTYKKRPIYWLFSSGKYKAFECLVYLHRYNEGTLARMRTEYVIPLSAKLNAYAEKLEQDKEASASAAETKRLEKEIATLYKQQAELAEFDEKLRHYADQRISLDLDDGVKVNYGKFGDLLAEVKSITGNAPGVSV